MGQLSYSGATICPDTTNIYKTFMNYDNNELYRCHFEYLAENIFSVEIKYMCLKKTRYFTSKIPQKELRSIRKVYLYINLY